jgi:hypothetical protein
LLSAPKYLGSLGLKPPLILSEVLFFPLTSDRPLLQERLWHTHVE